MAGSHAAGKALDVFSYDGGFSLHLASAGESVSAVDTSHEAPARLRVNSAMNGFGNIEPLQANGFDVLRELATRGERFETIVLDPPAFAKNRSSVVPARRGYKDINLHAMKLLRPGGILVTSTCSYHISELAFLDILREPPPMPLLNGSAGQRLAVARPSHPAGDARDALPEVCDLA